MRRTLVIALALAARGTALAQQQTQFQESAVGIEVRSDDGGVLGHVDAVERDEDGRIVSVEIAGLEPGEAPYAHSNLIAENERSDIVRVSDRRSETRAAGGERTAAR